LSDSKEKNKLAILECCSINYVSYISSFMIPIENL
jgi:hypothetical protein